MECRPTFSHELLCASVCLCPYVCVSVCSASLESDQHETEFREQQIKVKNESNQKVRQFETKQFVLNELSTLRFHSSQMTNIKGAVKSPTSDCSSCWRNCNNVPPLSVLEARCVRLLVRRVYNSFCPETQRPPRVLACLYIPAPKVHDFVCASTLSPVCKH